MIENRNTILAVILSGLVLIAWQYFYNIPTMEKQRAAQQAELAQKQAVNPASPTPANPSATPSAAGAPSQAPIPGGPTTNAPIQNRAAAIAAGPRVKIDTPSISGSIALTGARIDDVALVKYRETVDPKSPAIELFSPSGTKEPFYAEFGFVPAAGSTICRSCPTRPFRSPPESGPGPADGVVASGPGHEQAAPAGSVPGRPPFQKLTN